MGIRYSYNVFESFPSITFAENYSIFLKTLDKSIASMKTQYFQKLQNNIYRTLTILHHAKALTQFRKTQLNQMEDFIVQYYLFLSL